MIYQGTAANPISIPVGTEYDQTDELETATARGFVKPWNEFYQYEWYVSHKWAFTSFKYVGLHFLKLTANSLEIGRNPKGM